jgi:N,N'-diacetyllegionaminate synthase
MQLFDRTIGENHPAFIIAEAGVNHNGDMDIAKRLIDVAAEAGVDAVKFQTLNAARYISRYAPKARYQLAATDEGESQVDMVSKYELSREQHCELIQYCSERDLHFFSTAFDELGVDLLAELEVACFKIPSGEITNLPLIEHITAKGKPMILSTGMSSIGEVEKAVATMAVNGMRDIALLHCVSNYPALPEDANLRAMQTMEKAFGLPIGYSDHTSGVEIAIAAVALGARIIEKHFTIDKELPGPDHQASLEPNELRLMVSAIRNVEAGLGDGVKRLMSSENNTRDVARKSLVAARSLKVDEVIDRSAIAIKRPGTGISPVELDYVLGRRLKRDIAEDEPLSWDLLA